MPLARSHPSRSSLRRILVIGVWVCIASVLGVPAEAAQARVVILTEENPAYEAAVDASLGPLSRAQVTKVIYDREDLQATAEAVAKENPEIIMAVGSNATKLALRAFPDKPVVFAMVLNPVRSGILEIRDVPGQHVTGAVIDIPFELQFEKFREVIPGLHRLGVLSNPEDTGDLVAMANKAAERMGITLVVEPVESSTDVAAALKRLIDRGIDGLWTVADRTVVSKSTSQVILRETVRARIPTMGLSARHCRAGFLFSLDVDFAENGRQAGEQVVQIAQGASPSAVRIAYPKDVKMAVNTRIADFIGREIPAGVLKDASDVYR